MLKISFLTTKRKRKCYIYGDFYIPLYHQSIREMEEKPKFKIIYSEEVISFLNGLNDKAKAKIMFNINRSKYVIDKTFFKKLEGSDIWEFRTLYDGIQYRIFAFWDREKETLVVTTHGITKKTQKTPSKEIARAERIRKEYFESKK